MVEPNSKQQISRTKNSLEVDLVRKYVIYFFALKAPMLFIFLYVQCLKHSCKNLIGQYPATAGVLGNRYGWYF